MQLIIFLIIFLSSYSLFCYVFLQGLKKLGIKIDYKELFLFFLYLDGPTLTTDFGKNVKNSIGRYIINLFGDLGVNAVYFVLLLLSVAAGFAGVYLMSN